tara:strand:+ start:2015 stop:2278 length:264 start_codon:yes stop_codon:yes gene_type:complete
MDLYNNLCFDIIEKIGKEKVLIDIEKKQKENKKEVNEVINSFYKECIENIDIYPFEENDITSKILEFRAYDILGDFIEIDDDGFIHY